MIVRSAVLALVVSLLAAAAASASSVAVDGAQLVFRGTGAEQNYLALRDMPERPAYYVTDAKAPIVRGSGCEKGGGLPSYDGLESYDGFATYCRRDGVTNVLVELGGGDDAAFATVNVPATILGGDGVDQIEAPREGLADGGPGNDDMSFQGGTATLRGGPGRDLLALIYDGPATDPKGSSQPGFVVRQDGIANDGPVTDAHANVTGFERLFGGQRADVLYGSRRDDQISGDTGPDQIHAGRGDDRIDTIDAYTPADHEVHDIYSHYTHWRDRVWCGPGRDRVSAGTEDRWSADCERVDVYRTRMVSASEDPNAVAHQVEVVSYVVLNGDRRANHIVGTSHPDRIYARGGADIVNVAGGGRDVVHCGSGRDRVVADKRDRVGRDCEVQRRVAG